jgi:hypothetical protein
LSRKPRNLTPCRVSSQCVLLGTANHNIVFWNSETSQGIGYNRLDVSAR